MIGRLLQIREVCLAAWLRLLHNHVPPAAPWVWCLQDSADEPVPLQPSSLPSLYKWRFIQWLPLYSPSFDAPRRFLSSWQLLHHSLFFHSGYLHILQIKLKIKVTEAHSAGWFRLPTRQLCCHD